MRTSTLSPPTARTNSSRGATHGAMPSSLAGESPASSTDERWFITDEGVGSAARKDLVNDFVLTLKGPPPRFAPIDPIPARRIETLEALGLGGVAHLADNASAVRPGQGPEIARDGLLTLAEVRAASQAPALADQPGLVAEFQRLEALIAQPAAEPLALTPAVRVITRREEGRYEFIPENGREATLEQLPPAYRKMAERVLELLDRHTELMTLDGSSEHQRGGVINQAMLGRLEALSDLELSVIETSGPRTGPAGLRRLAGILSRHLDEHVAREFEPKNSCPAISKFPVESIKLSLETDPVPDVIQEGRLALRQLNRALVVQVPPGHTAVLNVQSVERPPRGAPGGLKLAEYVIGPTPTKQPAELPRVPGLETGAPAEVWVVVMKGREVVENRRFEVPANPITSRTEVERF